MDFGAPTLIELMDTEECAKLCQKLGLKFIELNMSFPQYQLSRIDIDRLRDIKERYGIYYTIHIDESLDPCSVNPDIARVYTENMLGTIELAKALSIPVLNMHLLRGVYVTLPGRRTYVYAENYDYYSSRLIEFRDAVTAAVGDSGIKVCIENTDGFNLPFLKNAVELLLESEVFMLTLDVGHDHAINNIDLPLILSHKDRLRHMHMHDAVGTSVHLALGDGELDKERFLSLAEECSCRVVLETKTLEALKTSSRWIAYWENRRVNPDELWDVYTPERVKTGRVHRRGELLQGDDCHLCVHVWIRNSRGEFLLTKRAEHKGFGGMWEAPGGCAVAGEDSLTSALREIEEETGLTLLAENGRVFGSYDGRHFFCDIWLFEQDFDLSLAKLQEGETTDIMFASPDTVRALCDEDKFVPIPYIDEILSV